MAAKVAPAPEGVRPGAGPGKGNGCCLVCCGGDPGPVPTEKVSACGGRFVRHDDGRVTEYFVFGSEKPGAKIMLFCNGSMGTGWFYSQLQKLVEKLQELDIKGISVTRPGQAYSSINWGANMLYWAEHDVTKVLEAEGGLPDKFMVEGVSQGTGDAMAIAYAHANRIEKLHLLVPQLPMSLSREVMPDKLRPPNGDKVELSATKLQGMGSCHTHCLYACGCSCAKCCMGPGSFQEKYTEAMLKQNNCPQKVAELQFKDALRNNLHHSTATFLWAMSDEYCAESWGFDVRDLAKKVRGKDRVLVSFATNDQMVQPDWCRYLVRLFDASYQVGDGNALDPSMKNGHSFWDWRLAMGMLVQQVVALHQPEQMSMDGNINSKCGVPVPEGFSLDVPSTASK